MEHIWAIYRPIRIKPLQVQTQDKICVSISKEMLLLQLSLPSNTAVEALFLGNSKVFHAITEVWLVDPSTPGSSAKTGKWSDCTRQSSCRCTKPSIWPGEILSRGEPLYWMARPDFWQDFNLGTKFLVYIWRWASVYLPKKYEVNISRINKLQMTWLRMSMHMIIVIIHLILFKNSTGYSHWIPSTGPHRTLPLSSFSVPFLGAKTKHKTKQKHTETHTKNQKKTSSIIFYYVF